MFRLYVSFLGYLSIVIGTILFIVIGRTPVGLVIAGLFMGGGITITYITYSYKL